MRLGGFHVLLHQDGRDGQHVADVVEAVAGVVGGEIFFGAELDAEQVADGVGVFGAIQAAGGDAAGVRLHVAVMRSNSACTIFDEGVDLRGVGLGHRLRGHFAVLDALDNPLPAFAMLGEGRGGSEDSQVQAALGEAVIVAGGAVFVEEGQDGFFEGPGGRLGRRERRAHG